MGPQTAPEHGGAEPDRSEVAQTLTCGHEREHRWCAEKEFLLTSLPIGDSLHLGQRHREAMAVLPLGWFVHSNQIRPRLMASSTPTFSC